jgi:hypothetical protein
MGVEASLVMSTTYISGRSMCQMHEPIENLPVSLDSPGATLRSTRWGRMAVAHVRCSKGTDFTPLLAGLEGDMCQCPHWGYVLKGALQIRYTDGREEIARAGEMWYAPPGHTAWCEEDTEYIDVSPGEEFDHVIAHIRSKMPG